jgi:hypothetical protein
MATSGIVSAYPFNMRKVIDHAMRRAGKLPENMSAEHLEIAKDLIFTLTSQWVNAGFPLWTKQSILYGPVLGSPDIVTLNGTVDVQTVYWRILNPYRGNATTTTGTDASVLFGGQPNSDVTITGVNPGVVVAFAGPTEVDTIGVLLGGSTPVTAALLVQTSADGVAWATEYTLPSATYTPGAWTYADLDPCILDAQFVRLVLPSATSTTWTLNQLQIGLANWQDIQIGPLNIDDYYAQPDKLFQAGQASSSYTDRLLPNVVVRLWPCPSQYAFYNALVSLVQRRYIQDPGLLTQTVEVPQRWYEALIWRLAKLLIFELPDQTSSEQASYFTLMAKQQRIQSIEAEASKAEALAWAEERTRAPIRIMPNISPYTA